MVAQRMPKVWKKKISCGKKTRWALMVGKEEKFSADEIYEWKRFYNGTIVAAIYKENKITKFAVVHLAEAITEFIDFMPSPTPGFNIVITGKKTDSWVTIIFRSGKKFYALDSAAMNICPLANETEADEIIDARSILI